jgi:hypothetical protein
MEGAPVRGGRLVAATTGMILAIAAGALLVPPSAGAEFRTGFQEELYVTTDGALRESLFDRSVAANASVVRINVIWRVVAQTPPANPSDPDDPAYRFGALDAAVRAAADRGLLPVLMVYNAPDYATGPGLPGGVRRGSWMPDPAALADFMRAIATRYSGEFGDLPQVRHFQVWNEPNLSFWLAPQRDGRRVASAAFYREMLNSAYKAIKGVNRNNVVLTAGTAPFGDDSGPERVRPLEFWRKVLCLRNNLKQRCKQKAKFDILAHHPINVLGPPRESAAHRDDATTSDFKDVLKTLRAAERAKTVTKGRHQLWATELWWETNPPDTDRGRPLEKQARWLQQALFILWRQGADAVLNFQVQDAPYDPAAPQNSLQSGVYFINGEPKASATAWAFPFAAERRRKRIVVWGKAPVAGKLWIERQAEDGWRRVAKVKVRAGQVFTKKLAIKGTVHLRATVGGQASLSWRQR